MSAVTANAVAAMIGRPAEQHRDRGRLARPAQRRHPARVRVVGRDGVGQLGSAARCTDSPSRSTRATMRLTAASRVRSVVR